MIFTNVSIYSFTYLNPYIFFANKFRNRQYIYMYQTVNISCTVKCAYRPIFQYITHVHFYKIM